LGIESGEGTLVVLFFFFAMALGFFHISFEISATTLFLDFYAEADLSKALLISGLAGLALTFFYSKMQAWVPFNVLLVGTFILLFFTTLGLRLGFVYYESPTVAFVLFVLMGPLYIISVIAYWGLAGRLFTMRQGKRLFGLVYSGQLFGVILLSAGTAFVLKMVQDVQNFMFISSGALLFAYALMSVILLKYNKELHAESQTHEENAEDAGRLNVLFKNRYVTVMAVFVILSMIAAFFIYFSFLSVAKIKYPESSDLATFLGMFIAFANFFSFLVRSFVYNKIIGNYGLKVTLLLVPTLLGIFSVSAIVVGHLFGTSGNDKQFVFFFIIIALSRLMYLTLKESVQLPTFEVMYQSLSKNIRFLVQAAIDGMVNEFSAIFSGLLLVGLSFLTWFGLLHYSYLLLVFIAFWIYVAYLLYQEYHQSLEQSLARTKQTVEAGYGIEKTSELSEFLLSSSDERDRIRGLFLSDTVAPVIVHRYLPAFLQTKSLLAVAQSVAIAERDELLALVEPLDRLPEKARKVKNLLAEFRSTIDKYGSLSALYELQRSMHPKDRVLATRLAEVANTDEAVKAVGVLLRDMIPNVRRSAISVAAQLKDLYLVPALIDNLFEPEFAADAEDALASYVKDCHFSLQQAFYKSGMDADVWLSIIRLLAQTKSVDVVPFLSEQFTSPVRSVKQSAIKALDHFTVDLNETQHSILQGVILDNASIVAWQIAVQHAVVNFSLPDELRFSVEKDTQRFVSYIFDGLAVLYDAKSVRYIQENIESGETEKINYALELLELFVAEEFKPILFPLFDDISNAEKLKLLDGYSAVSFPSVAGLCNALLAKDATIVSDWTKLCVLNSIANHPELPVSDPLVALVFGKSVSLKQYALHLLKEKNFVRYQNVLHRFAEAKAELKKMEDSVVEFDRYGGFFALVLSLKKTPLFEKTDCFVLEKLVAEGQFVDCASRTLDDIDYPSFVFVVKGSVAIKCEEPEVKRFPDSSILNDFLLLDGNCADKKIVLCDSETVLFYVKRKKWKRLLRTHLQLAEVTTAGLNL